jgi:hypothetical protein
MRARIALIAIGGLCLAACGGFRGPAVGKASVIPWIDATPPIPTPTPAPLIPAGLAACTMQDLQLAASITVVNVSGVSCVLQGVPGLTLIDARGSQIATTPSGYRITDRSDPVLLNGRGRSAQAYVPFAWPAIDQANGGAECLAASTAAQIRLDLPQGGGAVTVSTASPTDRPGTIAPCHGLIAVGAFQLVEPYVAPTPTPHPFAYQVTLPSSVRAGDNLSYLVTFTNHSAATVTFSDPCPAYHEDLYAGRPQNAPSLGKHRYLLNCRPAGLVAPQASVTFAMVLDVPATASPGNYILLWAPDEGIDTQDIQRLPLAIVGGS